MKKMFKKSIACLIAVLMVVASLPFTVISAQAADEVEITGAVKYGSVIFTHGTNTVSTDYNYLMTGTTIAAGDVKSATDCKTTVTTASGVTINSVSCVEDANANLSVSNGLLTGSFSSNHDDNTVTLKTNVTYNGKQYVSYNKVFVDTIPVPAHAASMSQRYYGISNPLKSINAYSQALKGSLGQTSKNGSSSSSAVAANAKELYEPGTTVRYDNKNDKNHWRLTNNITVDKVAGETGYATDGGWGKGTTTLTTTAPTGYYYFDKSTNDNYGFTSQGNGKYTFELVTIPFCIVTGDNADAGSVNLDTHSLSGDNFTQSDPYTTWSFSSGVPSIRKFTNVITGDASSMTSGTMTGSYELRFATNNSNGVWAVNITKSNWNVYVADKTVARNPYNTANSSIKTSDVYTADSWNAYKTAYLNDEEFLTNYKNVALGTVQAQATDLGSALTTAYNNLEVKKNTYTFVNVKGETVATCEAQNDSTAYFWAVTEGNVPNTAATTKTFAGNHQHKWVEYSWPTSATNYTFTEVATENFEACTEETTSEHKDATCTENGYDKETTTCSVCGNEDVKTTNIDATGHKMVYTRVDFDSHTKKCANGDIEETTEAHNFVDGVCEDCGAEEVDLTAYNKAVASLTAELEKTDIYTADSIADAKSELDTVTAMFNMGVVTTQAQVDSLTARLVTAQESLVRSNYVITFVIDKDGETTTVTENYPYGYVKHFDAGTDSVLKWTVEAQNGTTKLGTTDRVLDYVVARDAVVTAYVTADADTETEQYSKVTFIGHNRAVVDVKYVKAGDTLDTRKVDAPVISFYEFKGWDKKTVTGTGADITVTAEYAPQENIKKCTVVFGDFQKDYDYDAFVYLTDADENTRYAMYDANDNLLTYFVGKSFYVPHTDKVVIKEAGDEDVATSAITGYYKDGTSLVYNAKFYLPEGATLVKAGVEVTVGNKTVPFYADKVSSRNEYSYAIDFGSLTGVEVSARSFVVYKTADGEPQTVYSSTTVSQTL